MASSFQVLFGDPGQPAESAFYDTLVALEVEENADLPGALALTVPVTTRGDSPSDDLSAVSDTRFAPWARVAVVVSTDGNGDECIFDGFVQSHKLRLERGTASSSLRVWAHDASVLMNLVDVVKEWKDSDGTIANNILTGAPYHFRAADANTADDSGAHPDSGRTVMQRATDAQFLRDRARRNGKLFRVACEDRAGAPVGYFIKPDLEATPALNLDLNPTDTSTVGALEFEWDVARPTTVLAESREVTSSGLRALDARSLSSFSGQDHAVKVRLTAITDSAGDLQQRAASLLRESGWFVKCEGEVELSRLQKVPRVGRVVQVRGAGSMHSGKYFVWSVRHTITTESHRMRFVLVRNAVGGQP